MMRKSNGFKETPDTPLIVPLFVMNAGCPHNCIFCNQKITAGNYPQKISKEYFTGEVNAYLAWNKNKSRPVEIAFYGGSFTGMDPAYQEELLEWSQPYIRRGLVHSLRISTRPDYIHQDTLDFLKQYHVQTVEIGAQSFVDEVLQFAQRGHTAADSIAAIRLLKENNFRTGLHLMAGLPEDSPEGFLYSIGKTIELAPDMARIHPVVVLRGTTLAHEFEQGNFQPLALSAAVNLCALAWERITAAGIRVIRTGLHLTPEMAEEGEILAGPIHPAFGSMVLSAVFYHKTVKLLEQFPERLKKITFQLHRQDISGFRGLNNHNILAIKKLYPHTVIDVKTSPLQKRGLISAITDQGNVLIASIR